MVSAFVVLMPVMTVVRHDRLLGIHETRHHTRPERAGRAQELETSTLHETMTRHEQFGASGFSDGFRGFR